MQSLPWGTWRLCIIVCRQGIQCQDSLFDPCCKSGPCIATFPVFPFALTCKRDLTVKEAWTAGTSGSKFVAVWSLPQLSPGHTNITSFWLVLCSQLFWKQSISMAWKDYMVFQEKLSRNSKDKSGLKIQTANKPFSSKGKENSFLTEFTVKRIKDHQVSQVELLGHVGRETWRWFEV